MKGEGRYLRSFLVVFWLVMLTTGCGSNNDGGDVIDQAIVVSPGSGLVTDEFGGAAGFTVVLNTEPAADVTIGISSSDTTEGFVDKASLTFTASDWSAPQTVTITGVDDDAADGNQIFSVTLDPSSSSDADYAGLSIQAVDVTNSDNDAAGITVNQTSGLGTTEDGGTASFTVLLNTEPTADVTIGISSSDTTEGTVDKASLTFTGSDWSTPQTVTIAGVDDDIVDGDQIFDVILDLSGNSDAGYAALSSQVVDVTNSDNDLFEFITFAPESGPFANTVSLGDDEVSGLLDIGFSFVFFGNTYTEFKISSNGFITFDLALTDAGYLPKNIPELDTYNNIIAFAWTDFDPTAGGTISYETIGSPPNRRLVVNIENIYWFDWPAPSVTTQVILYEGADNVVEMHTTSQYSYEEAGAAIADAIYTQGVENAAGNEAVFVPGRVIIDYGLTNDAVRFYTNNL